jgi:hypothetical protein
MNDFDFHYMHYARAEELRKDAEHERLARSLIKAAKATRRGGEGVRNGGAHRGGVAGRVARAFGRKDAEQGRGANGSALENDHAAAS